MARTPDQIVADIRAFRPSRGYWRPLDGLLDELWATGQAARHIPELLAVLERFPEEDGAGVLWSIVHGLESLRGYEGALVRSVQRRPSRLGVTMLRRLLNSGVQEVGGLSLVGLLRTLTETPAHGAAMFPPLSPQDQEALAALLRAARDDPEEDAHRLVLGDWLEDHGDPRAELVRLSCQRARLAGTFPFDRSRAAALDEQMRHWQQEHGWPCPEPLPTQLYVSVWRGLLTVEVRMSVDPEESLEFPAGPDYEPDVVALPAFLAERLREGWVERVELKGVSDAAARLLTSARREYLAAPGLCIEGITRGWYEIPLGAEEWEAFTDDGLAHLRDLGTLRALDLNQTEVSDAGLRHLAGLAGLRALSLSETHVTGDGLHHLRHLKWLQALALPETALDDSNLAFARHLTDLRELRAYSPALTDAALDHLAGCGKLRLLGLSGTRIADAGVLGLARFTQLRHLYLARTHVTDVGLAGLARLAHLEELILNYTAISADGLAHLVGLASLRDLSLTHTPITDAGLAHVGQLAGLRSLNLSGTQVTDAGLAHLRGLTELRKLLLIQTPITDSALDHLQGLTSLRDLTLADTQVSAAGVARLKVALPDCKIWHRQGGSGPVQTY